MIQILAIFIAILQFQFKAIFGLQPSQVMILSRGEMYNSNTATQYYVDNITVLNVSSLSLVQSNLLATFTGWIQTGTINNLSNYESKIQIFNSASVNEKLLFFGNNSTHFILRQDISSSSSRCVCALTHQLSSTYRFVISIQQSSAGLQLSITLQLSDGTLQYCKQTSTSYIDTTSKSYLIAFEIQKPSDQYISTTEKMGDVTLLQNYAFARDATNSNLNEEKFLLGYTPSALQAFYFKFSYEQRDCSNCLVDSTENQIQAQGTLAFGVLEGSGAGGYYNYIFSQNQYFGFSKSKVRFGQPNQNFYNSLNYNSMSTSYNTMSLTLSFWLQFDVTVQSFQILSYIFPGNSLKIALSYNSGSSQYQLILTYSSTTYILSLPSTLTSSTSYHIAISMNSAFSDLYINGIFSQRTTINLATLFSQESTNGSFQIGGVNLPTTSTSKLSQFRMFTSSSIFSNQPVTINTLIANCFTLVQERQQYTCILCATGYSLNDAGQCVSSCSSTQQKLTSVAYCAPACSYRCATCSASDPLTCTSCGSQRVLKGTTCLCANGTFEDYKSLSCNSVKKLTAGFEIGQFTFQGTSPMTVTFKNAFTAPPTVLFSVLGYSVQNGNFGQFQVLGSSITATSMSVSSGVSGSSYILQVQYIAYLPSQQFYSGMISVTSLLAVTGNYAVNLGAYYTGKSTALYNLHIFLGGYVCNPALILFQSPTCQMSISVNSNKVSIDMVVNAILGVTSPTIYYLVTPPSITSFNLGINYSTNSIQYDPDYLEKYYASKIPLSPLNSLLSSLNTVGLDAMYSITSFNLYQQNFQYLKYQPNELSVSSGVTYSNFELYLNSLSVSSVGVQTTLFLDQFSDAVCGIKDYYTLNCLYCQNFGFNPNGGCTTCLSTFQSSGGNCITPIGYYYDSVSNSNLQCNSSCSTCTSATSCSVCKGSLVFNASGLCQCSQTNYWFDNSGTCSPCDPSCSTCSNGTTCASCLTGLAKNVTTQLCECSAGLWFNSGTATCQSCYFVCSTCVTSMSGTSENCTGCTGGRTLSSGNCVCSSNDPRLFQDDTRCSQSQQAILNAIMTNDYLNIQIDFGINISPLFTYTSASYSACQSLFDATTLALLGTGAQCSISGTIVSIALDGTARILPGNKVNFLPNSLQYAYNSLPILNFYRNTVSMIGLPFTSTVAMNNYATTINYCSQQSVQVQQIQFDGKRGFQVIQWSIVSIIQPDSNTQTALLQAINQANTNQSSSLIVFLPMVQQDTMIQVQLAWTLWVGQSGVQNINILIQKKKFLQVSHNFLTASPFYVYKNISIEHSFACQMCDSTGKVYTLDEPLTITVLNSQLGIDNVFQGYTSNSLITQVNAFSMVSSNTYVIEATFKVESDTTINYADTVNLYITPSQLIVKLLGGSRYASYQNLFTISGFFKDLEVQNTALSTQGITTTWSCLNIGNQLPCTTSQGAPVSLQQGQSSISINSYTFSPYTVAQFEVVGTKITQEGTQTLTRTGTDSIIVFITELDIPVLEVIVSDDLIIDPTINPNQLIHAQMIYPTVNTDILYYSGAIIYNNTVVGVIEFDYNLIRFQVWDYYGGFTADNANIQVRFSVYNPQYILPSLCTLNFVLNFPPTNCALSVTYSNTKYSLIDTFQISLNSCQSANSPLSYQFFYYSAGTEYNFELHNYLQLQREQLSDISFSNSISTFLPGGPIQILAQAIDVRGAISNSTYTINVDYQTYAPNDFLNFITLFIQTSSALTHGQYILNLNLLSQEILNREAAFPTIAAQLSQQKITIINNLQLAAQQVIGTSYFYQLAMQTVSLLLSSITGLSSISQQTQLSLITSNLQGILQRCVPSSVSQLLYEKCVEDIYLTFNWVDSLSQVYNEANAGLNGQYVTITEVISDMLNQQAYPNENAILFQGQNIQMVSQRITQKNLIDYVGMNTGSQNFRRMLQSSTTSSSSGSSTSSSSNQTATIYDVSYNTYQSNFYSQDASFKNYTNQIQNLTNKTAYQYPVVNPIIKDTSTNTTYNPTNGAIHYFNIQDQQQNLTCFAKTQSTGSWLQNSCSTRVINSTSQIQCLCPDLSPTTVIQDISDLFLNNENIETAFSSQGLSNLSNFTNFYQYLVFWVVLGQTVLFICLVFYGMKLDTQFLYGGIPIALRKISNFSNRSSISKVVPMTGSPNTMKAMNTNNQPIIAPTNQGVTYTITEEDEIKGVEESPLKISKKPTPVYDLQLVKLDELKKESNKNENENDQEHENDEEMNKDVQQCSNHMDTSRAFNKQHTDSIFSTATNQQSGGSQNPQGPFLSSRSIQFQRKRSSVRTAKQAFEKDFQFSKEQSSTPSTMVSIANFKTNSNGQKRDSDPAIESRQTTCESENNIFNIRLSSLKQPSIVKMCDPRDIDTPQSAMNRNLMNKIASASTIPDCFSLDQEHDKQKMNHNTPPTTSTISSSPEKPKFQRRNKREQGINFENEITDEEKNKLTQINKFKYFIHFHDFISIFLVFNYEISRAARFILFYVRYEHTLAMSILFGENKTFVQRIFVSIASSISILLISLVIENLLTAKRCIRRIGILFSLLVSAFYAYIILSIVSGQQPDESNQFIGTYVLFLVTDVFVFQTLTALTFGLFARNVVTTPKEEHGCLKKLFDLLKLNIVVNALIK